MLLLVEVGDTTVRFDRGRKAALYAYSGIPEYWLADIPADEIEIYRGPSAEGYREARKYRGGEALRPVAFPELAVPVAEVLP